MHGRRRKGWVCQSIAHGWHIHWIQIHLLLLIVEVLPAEDKDGRAPFVEELERPVIDGGGVDLKEVFEDGQARGGHAGQGRHVFLVYLS